jgi:hypothetical protein
MYKTLILPIFLCSPNVLADASSGEGCGLGFQKLTPNTLTFSYTPQAKTDRPYFYVKAIKEGETPENNLASIMATGENLAVIQDTKPFFYQLPEHTKMLYILNAKSKLESMDSLAQIVPTINDPRDPKNRPRRNASNYPQPLPDATNQLQPIKNVVIYPAELPEEKKKVQVCELTL